MRAVAITMFLFAGLAVLWMVWPAVIEWFEIDRCLDAGGKWQPALHQCQP
jgi:hypothetical protein